MSGNRIIFGVIILVLGVALLIDQTGVFSVWGINLWSLIWNFWPILFVALGIKLLAQRNTTGGLILTTLGALLLTSNLTEISFWSVIWPIMLIAIGVSLLFKDQAVEVVKDPDTGKTTKKAKKGSQEDYVNQSAVFGGFEKRVLSDKFTGGEITSVFGGAKLDLSDVKIAKDGARVEVNAIFGGVEIVTPINCRVITNGTGILGAWVPMLEGNDVEEPVLEITGVAVFGGVEIK